MEFNAQEIFLKSTSIREIVSRENIAEMDKFLQ